MPFNNELFGPSDTTNYIFRTKNAHRIIAINKILIIKCLYFLARSVLEPI